MTTELEIFSKTFEDKTPNTQRSYISQYKKLNKLLGTDIIKVSQAVIISKITELPNINGQQALLNIAIAIHRDAGQEVDKLVNRRDKNKEHLKEAVKDTNLKLQQKLPSYEQVVDYTDNLFEIGDYKGFIINWLILNYQVRNVDLNFDIVMRKKQANDKNKNYIWLAPNKVVYIRNVYKTASTYGQKVYTITDARVIVALKRIKAFQKNGEAEGTFIPNENQVGYYVLNATMDKMGEGNMFKIVVNHFSQDLQKIHEISQHRGSSMDVISTNYDIKNV